MSTQDIEVVHDNFTCGDKLIRASFLFMDGGRVTVCFLHDFRRADVPAPINGISVCNPSDTLDRAEGMKRAMRRACVNIKVPEGWGNEFSRVGSKVYQAYRYHLHLATLPAFQEKIAHYVIVNREVVGVTEEQHTEWERAIDEPGKRCQEPNGYVCSRPRGHSGPHIARGDRIYRVWDDDCKLTDAEFLALKHERNVRDAAITPSPTTDGCQK